ncbi:MAG: tetratricopeptide repeat protein [Myxococcales bacterium]|nr:tetratricopeptide repeat protein [Myxococcales bacterium]
MRWPLVMVVCALPTLAAAQPRLPIPIRGQQPEPTPAERAFSQGDTLLQRGDFTGALPHFEAARRLDPRDPRPVFYLGEVSFRQGQFAQAEPLFREAIRLNPAMAEAHAELGATLRALRRLDDAVAALREAIRLAPSLGEAHQALGLCLEERGALAEAIVAYRNAARHLRDDPAPLLSLAAALASARPAGGSPAHTEALQSLREAVRRADRDAASLAEAGPLLRQLGDAPGAVRALSRARALQSPPSPVTLGELAQAHAAANQLAQAETRITEALGLRPNDAGLHYLHALIRLAARDTAGAIAALQACLRLEPTGERATRARARLTALGRPER